MGVTACTGPEASPGESTVALTPRAGLALYRSQPASLGPAPAQHLPPPTPAGVGSGRRAAWAGLGDCPAAEVARCRLGKMEAQPAIVGQKCWGGGACR